MSIEYNWITGFNVGFEFFSDVDNMSGLLIDLGILRILFINEQDNERDL